MRQFKPQLETHPVIFTLQAVGALEGANALFCIELARYFSRAGLLLASPFGKEPYKLHPKRTLNKSTTTFSS